MNDDDRDVPNPADLLPFVCELEPADPNVERLPAAYMGSGGAVDSVDNAISNP